MNLREEAGQTRFDRTGIVKRTFSLLPYKD